MAIAERVSAIWSPVKKSWETFQSHTAQFSTARRWLFGAGVLLTVGFLIPFYMIFLSFKKPSHSSQKTLSTQQQELSEASPPGSDLASLSVSNAPPEPISNSKSEVLPTDLVSLSVSNAPLEPISNSKSEVLPTDLASLSVSNAPPEPISNSNSEVLSRDLVSPPDSNASAELDSSSKAKAQVLPTEPSMLSAPMETVPPVAPIPPLNEYAYESLLQTCIVINSEFEQDSVGEAMLSQFCVKNPIYHRQTKAQLYSLSYLFELFGTYHQQFPNVYAENKIKAMIETPSQMATSYSYQLTLILNELLTVYNQVKSALVVSKPQSIARQSALPDSSVPKPLPTVVVSSLPDPTSLTLKTGIIVPASKPPQKTLMQLQQEEQVAQILPPPSQSTATFFSLKDNEGSNGHQSAHVKSATSAI